MQRGRRDRGRQRTRARDRSPACGWGWSRRAPSPSPAASRRSACAASTPSRTRPGARARSPVASSWRRTRGARRSTGPATTSPTTAPSGPPEPAVAAPADVAAELDGAPVVGRGGLLYPEVLSGRVGPLDVSAGHLADLAARLLAAGADLLGRRAALPAPAGRRADRRASRRRSGDAARDDVARHPGPRRARARAVRRRRVVGGELVVRAGPAPAPVLRGGRGRRAGRGLRRSRPAPARSPT